MRLTKAILAILMLSLSAGAQATERRYLASMDESRWILTDSSNLICRMEHPIPRFGKVIFTQEAGRGLQLELRSSHAFAKGVNVELRSETASWNARQTRAVLGRFETGGGRSLFRIPGSVAEKAFYELRRGLQPGFLFYTDDPLIASLSTVRFGEAEAEFTLCTGQLYERNFDDVRISSIHFEPDHEFASIREEERAFTRMLDYLQVDPGIAEVVVTGHTDNTGLACYNEGLSERRAWYVYDLLIASGVDAGLLRVEYAGESEPASRGKSKKALAANRRVTVELRR